MSSPSRLKRIRLVDSFCNHKPSLSSSEDLLTDIFLRLPTKTLVRLTSVCKHWKSLIFNPEFSMSHFRRSSATYLDPNPTGVYFYNVLTSKQYSVSFGSRSGRLPPLTKLVGRRTIIEYACNGLMLFWNNDINRYVVGNLTTKMLRVFEIPESIAHCRHCSYIAFDPSKSPFYKVVVLAVFGDDCEFHIYSSQTASWKLVRTECSKSGMLHSRPVFYKGKFHWLGGKQFMMGFDVDKEQLSRTEFWALDDFIQYKCIRYFGLCKGRLVMVLSTSENEQRFKVLEMKEEDRHHRGCVAKPAPARWVVKAEIDLRNVMTIPDNERAVVMCVLKTGKNQYDLVMATYGEVVLYSMKSRMFEVLEHWPKIDLKSLAIFNSGSVFPFIGTLVPI